MTLLSCFQDADEGITTEEATNILVSSYKSSEYSNDVQNEIAKISVNVSFTFNSFLPFIRAYRERERHETYGK